MSEQKPQTEISPKVSYSGGPGHWRGVIKLNGKAVWTCPHFHPNRDQSTSQNRIAAQDCARTVLILATEGKEGKTFGWLWKSDPPGTLYSTHRSAMPALVARLETLMPLAEQLKEAIKEQETT